ncbi:MAG: bifunctional diaminohydroxyphosphoribosylaminopyrimidine deaminase/5-amino-6-(5-phosphoribosylamino)uracil reductase RibD [Actinomycetota bacterium]
MEQGQATGTSSLDAAFARALELAARGSGRVSPNPLVGAVVLRDGAIVGDGFHDGPGTPHAEVVALRAAGDRARGATLVCTLEPCDHQGRTPACTAAVIDAGIARVEYASPDPNPLVDGRGARRLRTAGVQVRAGAHRGAADRLNGAYLHHVRTGLPIVRWKAAATLDGKVAARDRTSRWITGEAARRDVHAMRAWADAIVVGAGTALADDPSLTVQLEGSRARPTMRVLVDAAGGTPASGALFDGAPPTLVATTERSPSSVRDAWRAAGAEVLVLDGTRGTEDERGGLVALRPLLEDLGKRDVQGVLLEGGPTLAWGFASAGLIDQVVLYLAPKLLGGIEAPGALGGTGFAPVTEALDLRIDAVDRIGDDVRVEAHVHRDH